MASSNNSFQEPFDKELWKKSCQEEFVEFVTKTSPKYPLVLKRYRDTLAMRKSPEYIKLKQTLEKEKREWVEWVNSEEYKQEQKAKSEAYKKKKEDEKKWLEKARESMSWGT